MTWTNAGSFITTADGQDDRRRVSNLVFFHDKIHFLYEKRDSTNAASTSRIYYRTYNGLALSNPVRVFATETASGQFSPSLAVNHDGVVWAAAEAREHYDYQAPAMVAHSLNGTDWVDHAVSGDRYAGTQIYCSGDVTVAIYRRGNNDGTFLMSDEFTVDDPTYVLTSLMKFLGPLGPGGQLQTVGLYNIPKEHIALKQHLASIVTSRSVEGGTSFPSSYEEKRISAIVAVTTGLLTGPFENNVYQNTYNMHRQVVLKMGSDNKLRAIWTDTYSDENPTAFPRMAISSNFGLSWTLLPEQGIVFRNYDTFGNIINAPFPGWEGELGMCLDRDNQWWVTWFQWPATPTVEPNPRAHRLHTFKGREDGRLWEYVSSENITDGLLAANGTGIETLTGPSSTVVWGPDLYRVCQMVHSGTGLVEMRLLKNAAVAAAGRGPTGGSQTPYRYSE